MLIKGLGEAALIFPYELKKKLLQQETKSCYLTEDVIGAVGQKLTIRFKYYEKKSIAETDIPQSMKNKAIICKPCGWMEGFTFASDSAYHSVD